MNKFIPLILVAALMVPAPVDAGIKSCLKKVIVTPVKKVGQGAVWTLEHAWLGLTWAIVCSSGQCD